MQTLKVISRLGKTWRMVSSLSSCVTRKYSTDPAPPDGKRMYKTWDDGFVARQMTREELVMTGKWFHESWGAPDTGHDDFLLAYECAEPAGENFIMYEMHGKTAGCSASPTVAPNVVHGTNVFVCEEFRGQRVLDRMIGHIRDSAPGRVIGASSDISIKGLHRQGYIDLWSLKFLTGQLPPYRPADGIVKANSVQFDKIIEYDNKVYMVPNFLPRRNTLRRLVDIQDGLTLVSTDIRGNILGFGCRRPSIQPGIHIIGPLYADDSETAEKLLLSMRDGLKDSDKVGIVVIDRNDNSLKLLDKYGFSCVGVNRSSMYGPKLDFYKAQNYAITSHEIVTC